MRPRSYLPTLAVLGVTSLGVGLPALAHAQAPNEDEDEETKASPDVQAQVGMGTEKEDEERDDAEPAAATTDDDARDVDESAASAPSFGHGWQFGLRVGVALGYEMMFRYDDSPPCDVGAAAGEDRSVCGFGSPASLDLALSFALLDSIEPYVWLRFGLADQTQTATAARSVFGAGLRIYTMSDSQLKLFFEPAFALRTEGRLPAAPVNANYDTDYLVHLHFGLQYDFSKYFGMYGSAGPNVSFSRALSTELDASIGVQGRFP